MKNKQFPSQTGIYKVKVKSGSTWKNFNTCRLQISVGQEKHESHKFQATMEWAYNRFEKIIVCVNDVLQRFNLIHDKLIDEKTATQDALQEGTLWIERNLTNKYRDKVIILRWDYWKKLDGFEQMRLLVNRLYEGNETFRKAVESEIDEFLARRDNTTRSNWRQLCKDYLLEECAVFPLMFAQDKAADIYPGTTLLPIRLVEEGKIEGFGPIGDVVFTRIDFASNRPKEAEAS